MGLFDAFSASSGKKAARQGFLAQKAGLDRAEDFTRQGLGEATGALTQGRGESLGYLDQGIAPQQGLLNRGQQGIDYYGQLVGLPGAGGPGVQQTLENIPGYQFARDQGIDALNRTANARGMLASGNNTQDILRFSQGLADQNYFNYLNAVQPYFGLGQNAASGIQSGFTNKANVARGTGQDIAGVNTAAFGNLANLGVQGGQARADMFTNQYNAGQTANQNLWNAILGLAGGVTGAAGKAGGFGALFS